MTKLAHLSPSEVQPLEQQFVPPQHTVPDGQQTAALVLVFVHTLAVGQHASLTQTVPEGQQV